MDTETGKNGGGNASGPKDDEISVLRRELEGLAEKVANMSRKQLSGVVEDAKDMGKEKLADVEDAIRRNPTQSALIAAGIGFIAALFLTR
jgi:ElaB/YqjD/DUF883 family membrane-anchored ribosome-binding protein